MGTFSHSSGESCDGPKVGLPNSCVSRLRDIPRRPVCLMRRARERAEPRSDDPAAGQRCARRFLFRLAIEGCPFIGSSFTACFAAISLLPTRAPSSPAIRVRFLSPTLPINFCKQHRRTSTTLELSIPACGKTAIFPPPASAFLVFLSESRERVPAGQTSADAIPDSIPSCEVGSPSLHRSSISRYALRRRYRWP